MKNKLTNRTKTFIDQIEENKSASNYFFSFQTNLLQRSVSYCYIREKSKNRLYFKDTFTHGGSTIVIMRKRKTFQLLLITENACNKQIIKEKD